MLKVHTLKNKLEAKSVALKRCEPLNLSVSSNSGRLSSMSTYFLILSNCAISWGPTIQILETIGNIAYQTNLQLISNIRFVFVSVVSSRRLVSP